MLEMAIFRANHHMSSYIRKLPSLNLYYMPFPKCASTP